MTILIKKLFICIVLLCSIPNIKGLDVDKETQEKIVNLVGEKQLALRSYLGEVKSKIQTIEYNYRNEVSNSKTSLKTEVDKIINDIKPDTGKSCDDQVTQAIQEISKQSDTIHNNCALSTKPNILSLNQDATKHAEFQSKIGEAPTKCLDSNNDVDSVVKCIEKSVEDIGKQMKEGENQLNSKIYDVKQQTDELQNSLDNCQDKGLVDLKSKSKEIKDKLNQC